MDPTLDMKSAALADRIGGRGRTLDHYMIGELPLMQDIRRAWLNDRVRPYSVSLMVETLLRGKEAEGGDNDPYGVVEELNKAIDAAAPWEEACRRAGWLDTRELGQDLLDGREGTAMLNRLVNLITMQLDSDQPQPGEEILFYWELRSQEWDDIGLKTVKRVVSIREAVDAAVVAAKAAEPHDVHKKATSVIPPPRLMLQWVEPDHRSAEDKLRFTHDVTHTEDGAATLGALPPTTYFNQDYLVDAFGPSLRQWLWEEWLGHETANYFVSFDEQDWSSQETWPELGQAEGVEADPPEVAQWYIVDRNIGEHLQALGYVVAFVGDDAIFGRVSSGSALWSEAAMWDVAVRAGHMDWLPPLGWLNDESEPGYPRRPTIRVCRGRCPEYPLARQDYEDDKVVSLEDAIGILSLEAVTAGVTVEWGPAYREHGALMTPFRIVVPDELNVEPEWD